jgi:broad specificity phosphatase PhoE/ribonuclease HI
VKVIVEADGGSRGNPGPAGYGAVVLATDSTTVLAERKEFIGVDTNNVAEYRGLIAGLSAALELGANDVLVRMDSKLVVEQMSGRWQVKHPSMRPLARAAGELVGNFDRVTFQWIPRAQNTRADRLANEAMDAGTGSAPKRRPDPVVDSKPTGTWLPPSSVPTRFVMVRHGVTAYSVAKRFAGRSDLDLTADGEQQAARAAERVAQIGGIDVVLSSPLLRTRHTAQIIADRLGLSVQTNDGLMETDFGTWDGYTFAEVLERWPDEMARWSGDSSIAPPGGESFDDVTVRVRRARDQILSKYAEQTVLVVSHVTPIKVLVRLALDAPMSALHRMYLAPASVSVLDYFSDGNCALQSFNENAHLAS